MNITVVLVTFNRLDCLKKALELYESQSLLPKRLIVIDNNSKDGTHEFLNKWSRNAGVFEKRVITTERNLGGAGGFATGLKAASEYMDSDWVWISDDDAYPEPDVFLELSKYYGEISDNKEIVALFSSVVNHGKYDLLHRRTVNKSFKGIRFIDIPNSEYNKKYFELRQGSYVGMLVKFDTLKSIGVTDQRYFIQYDDTDHCERLAKIGKLYCIPSAIVHHDVSPEEGYSWKNYYSFRNKVILLDRYFGKKYALIEAIKRYSKSVSIFSDEKNSKPIKKMLKIALFDGLQGKMGLHLTYKPGWTPSVRKEK